jgi:hypothetical protein
VPGSSSRASTPSPRLRWRCCSRASPTTCIAPCVSGYDPSPAVPKEEMCPSAG